MGGGGVVYLGCDGGGGAMVRWCDGGDGAMVRWCDGAMVVVLYLGCDDYWLSEYLSVCSTVRYGELVGYDGARVRW